MPTILSSLDRIDEKIASRSLLTHPFYQAWTQGSLTREALRSYTQQYYQHVAAFLLTFPLCICKPKTSPYDVSC